MQDTVGSKIQSQPRLCHVQVLRAEGFRSMAYMEWGDPDSPRVVVCAHGLTRNSRDFDSLATALVRYGYRVICPDVLGRGRSQKLLDPMGYSYPLYLADMATLVAHLRVDHVDWVGTSMGGLIGLFLAGTAQSPIRRLLLNDIGPFIPKQALQTIVEALTDTPSFASRAEAEAHMRQRYVTFGVSSDDQWQSLVDNGVWTDPQDATRLVLAFDPQIAVPIAATEVEDVDLWTAWGLVRCPVMVVRGAESTLLRQETVHQMVDSHGACIALEIPGAGHAPLLCGAEEQTRIGAWLTAP